MRFFRRFDKRITYTGTGKPWSPSPYREMPADWSDNYRPLWDALCNTFPFDLVQVEAALALLAPHGDEEQRAHHHRDQQEPVASTSEATDDQRQ